MIGTDPFADDGLHPVRGLKRDDVTKTTIATSVRELWRDYPWWATLLLAIAVLLFVLEAVGVVRDGASRR